MRKLTSKWLESINEEFSKKDVPYKQRPWLAWAKWSEHIGLPTALGDEDAKKIFAWFEDNLKPGVQHIGPMYTGAYYYDSLFWPVVIPVVAGTVKLDAANSLKAIPDSIKTRLLSDTNERQQFALFWADCIDYGFGADDLIDDSYAGNFWQELIKSGDQQLNATVTLLLEQRPNSIAMELARMATEMFLKTFLANKTGLTDAEARRKISHDLEKALDKCLAIDSTSELAAIRPELSVFPEIHERYKGTDKTLRDLWCGYRVAQFTGVTVIRSLSGRDARTTMTL